RTNADQSNAQCEDCTENDEGPVQENATDEQDDTHCCLACHQPANAKDAKKRKNEFRDQGPIVFLHNRNTGRIIDWSLRIVGNWRRNRCCIPISRLSSNPWLRSVALLVGGDLRLRRRTIMGWRLRRLSKSLRSR